MDAKTRKRPVADQVTETVSHAHELAEAFTAKRDRLLAALTLIAGIGLIVALPFALRGGAEFFLPVTAALVIAIALVPLLEWYERRGIPSRLASAMCIFIFLLLAVFAIGSIVLPAIDWVALIPERIGKVKTALEPILDLYKSFDKFTERIVSQIAISPAESRTVAIETPNSLSSLLATSAPHLLIQLFFALLVIFFFLSGWTAMRKKTIVSRGSFEGALVTARVIQQVVD
jgi:predicted PurR-regulated permease PerM